MPGRVTGIRGKQNDDAAGMSSRFSHVGPTERPFEVFVPLSKLKFLAGGPTSGPRGQPKSVSSNSVYKGRFCS